MMGKEEQDRDEGYTRGREMDKQVKNQLTISIGVKEHRPTTIESSYTCTSTDHNRIQYVHVGVKVQCTHSLAGVEEPGGQDREMRGSEPSLHPLRQHHAVQSSHLQWWGIY